MEQNQDLKSVDTDITSYAKGATIGTKICGHTSVICYGKIIYFRAAFFESYQIIQLAIHINKAEKLQWLR